MSHEKLSEIAPKSPPFFFIYLVYFLSFISHPGISIAAPYRLDDSLTTADPPAAQMQWRSIAPGRGMNHDVEARIRVFVKLKTMTWIGKNSRIYMNLTPDANPPVMLEWQTQGTLVPGKLVSGQRTLVYSGPIKTPLLEDLMIIHLRTDGRWTDAQRRLEFHFELETE